MGTEIMRQRAIMDSLRGIGAVVYYAALVWCMVTLARTLVWLARDEWTYRKMRRERLEDCD